MKHSAWLAVALGLSAGSVASAAELLVNGDFEDGDTQSITGGVPGWSSWGGSGWHHSDPGETLGTKAMVFWWDDTGMWQDVTITPGTTLDYGVQVLHHSGDATTWNLLVRLEFYNSALGTDPANMAGQEQVKFVSANEPLDQWVFTGGTAVAPANADIARIVINLTDWVEGAHGTLNFDNATIVTVPEPASLVLLALGLAAVSRSRGVRTAMLS